MRYRVTVRVMPPVHTVLYPHLAGPLLNIQQPTPIRRSNVSEQPLSPSIGHSRSGAPNSEQTL
jgi:hypothetical protein